MKKILIISILILNASVGLNLQAGPNERRNCYNSCRNAGNNNIYCENLCKNK